MSKCNIVHRHIANSPFESSTSERYCVAHGMVAPGHISTDDPASQMCVVGMAEKVVDDRMAAIDARLDQLFAVLARIEGQTDLYCKGHPFQHTFVVAGGRCGHCGKMAMPQGAI